MKSFVVSGVGQVHRGLAGAVYHGAHSDAAVICGVNVDTFEGQSLTGRTEGRQHGAF
jgi:hypothetical protein